MIGVDPQTLALLCAVAGLAGCIDAIGGGGGLITVPALMLAGLDPVTAIATNKAQGAAGAMSSALAFARAKMVDWRAATPVALLRAPPPSSAPCPSPISTVARSRPSRPFCSP